MSEVGKLEEKIRKKRESERAELKRIATEELQNFQSSWKRKLANVQHTIDADIKRISSDQIEQLRAMGEEIEANRRRVRSIFPHMMILVGSVLVLNIGAWWLLVAPTPPPSPIIKTVPIEVNESDIARSEDGTEFVPVSKISNLKIIKSKEK